MAQTGLGFQLVQVEDPRFSRVGNEDNYAVYATEQRERRLRDAARYDFDQEFTLPIDYRPEQSLNTEGIRIADVNTPLEPHNIGYKLLQKMGWRGGGLGKDETGIKEPIKAGENSVMGVRFGIGKMEQVSLYTNEENITRKKMDTEVEETEELAQKRQDAAEKEMKLKEDITQMNRDFYCELCNKQYKTALEIETHLSSYDHHHKKRLMEMKEMTKNTAEIANRDKKEKAREDKEMAKFAKLVQVNQQAVQETQSQVGLAELPEQRSAVKISFGGMAKPAQKPGVKVAFGGGLKAAAKPPLSKVSAAFAMDDSDEEE